MPTPKELFEPTNVIAISPGYVEVNDKSTPRPIIAIGRNARLSYRACVLDDDGRLRIVEHVMPL